MADIDQNSRLHRKKKGSPSTTVLLAGQYGFSGAAAAAAEPLAADGIRQAYTPRFGAVQARGLGSRR